MPLVYHLSSLSRIARNHAPRIAYPVSQVFAGRSTRTKRFPHFTTYLTEVVERRITRFQRTATMIGCSLMLVTTPVVATIAWLAAGFGAAVLSAVVAWPVSALAWFFIDRRLRRSKSPEEAKRMESWKASKELLQLDQQRRFHKRMDPSMSQLLEAAAFHYARIQAAASGSFWSNDSLPAHWRSVRSQSLEAAEQAMEELVMLAMPCTGEPQTDRGKAFKEAVGDLVDLDIGLAIDSLREVATADWTRYAHRSPYLKEAFEPGRAIAERMKRLADEIEQRAEDAVKESGQVLPADAAVNSLDIVLSEISSVEKAEDELQQRTRG